YVGFDRRGDTFLRASFVLDAQNAFAHFATAIFDNRRLPIGVRLAQLFEQSPGEAVLGERGFKLGLMFQLLPLLGGHISFEECLTRIVGLRAQGWRGETNSESCEQGDS